MEYYGNNDWRDYHLSHHGILGMRWGRRNGPPYPLDPSDHSASEKKAGWRQSLGSGRNAESKAKKKKDQVKYRNDDGTLTEKGEKEFKRDSRKKEELSSKIIDYHEAQRWLFNNYAYETPAQRERNDKLYTQIVETLVKDLHEYKKLEETMTERYGKAHSTALDMEYRGIKTMYVDSPYNKQKS